jgi:membrane-associated phospholipid phosphatase
MKRGALVIAAAAALVATPAAAAPSPRPSPRTVLHLAIVVGGTAAYVSSETVLKDELAPDRCRWCQDNGLDRGVRDGLRWGDTRRANQLSNLTAFALTPVVSASLLGAAGYGGGRWLEDGLALAESAVATGLVTQVVKISVGRRRPYVSADDAPSVTVEDNLSFFSGHTSLTFALATSAGTIASMRGDRLAPYLWASGLALAATSAYLRIAADRHWFTDVATGAVAGSAIGVAVPRLVHRHLHGQALTVAVVPGRVMVGGAF